MPRRFGSRRGAARLRGSLIIIGCSLIGVPHDLLLTCVYSGRGLIDAPCRRLPGGDTRGGLISAARHPLLASGNSRGDFVDATSYQLLTGGDSVEALSHCVEVAQYLVEPLLIGVRGD
jgi:hypothetical protein